MDLTEIEYGPEHSLRDLESIQQNVRSDQDIWGTPIESFYRELLVILRAWSEDDIRPFPEEQAIILRLSQEYMDNAIGRLSQLSDSSTFNEAMPKISLKYGPRAREAAIAAGVGRATKALDIINDFTVSRSDLAAIAAERERILSASSEMSVLLTQARAQVGEVVSLAEAQAFVNRAQGYRNASIAWLLGTGVVALALLWLCVWIFWVTTFHEVPPPTTSAEVYAAIFSKTALIVGLGYALTLCSRNYAANRHNQVVNLHRADALASYRALLAPTSSDAHRDIILTHAATAIFAPQDSGFSKSASGSDAPTVINTIAEGLKTTGKA